MVFFGCFFFLRCFFWWSARCFFDALFAFFSLAGGWLGSLQAFFQVHLVLFLVLFLVVSLFVVR